MEGYPDKTPAKKSSLIIGRQPVIEAIESGRAVDKILLQAGVTGENIGVIRRLAKEHAIPVQQVPVQKLSSLTRSNHQGCIAYAALVAYMDLQQVIDHVVSRGEAPLFLMLDGITDVRNIGGMARTALCCGAQAIIIPDKGVGALNEEALKSSAGALEKLQICRVSSLLKAIEDLRLNGIKAYVTGMKESKTLFDIDFKEPCCIVMGSEDKGVQPYISKAADDRFSIPMAGDFDSFNVSVATGIILFESLRQRRLSI